MNWKQKLGSNFRSNEPASEILVQRFQDQSGLLLTKEYVDFLRSTNGGEGIIGNGQYVALWQIDDLERLNKAYQVEEYAPGLFLFGSDGGGEAFAFDLRKTDKPIVSVPFVGMSLDDVHLVADTFTSFLDELSKEAE